MKTKEKQTEEMAEAIFQNCNCGLFFSEAEKIARFVIEEQGYRKQSEVIDELVKRLKEEPIKLSLPLFGLSTKDEIEAHFNDIMLEVRDAIDRIAKEMKGGEK